MLALTSIFSFSSRALIVSLGLWPDMLSSDSLDILSLSGIGVNIIFVMVLKIFLYLIKWLNPHNR